MNKAKKLRMRRQLRNNNYLRFISCYGRDCWRSSRSCRASGRSLSSRHLNDWSAKTARSVSVFGTNEFTCRSGPFHDSLPSRSNRDDQRQSHHLLSKASLLWPEVIFVRVEFGSFQFLVIGSGSKRYGTYHGKDKQRMCETHFELARQKLGRSFDDSSTAWSLLKQTAELTGKKSLFIRARLWLFRWQLRIQWRR